MDSIAGLVFPFSQLKMVRQLQPSLLATSFWLSRNSKRRFRICSPKLRGSQSMTFGFKPLSVTDAYGKKATRPCPCGYLGHYSAKCHCTPEQVARYRRRISGPLLDRIDLHIEVPAVPPDELSSPGTAEPSASMAVRAAAARLRQIERQAKPNAYMSAREINQHARPDAASEQLLKHAISRLGLSARGYHRILKVARTIADLAGSQAVRAEHIAEAIQYRRLDRS
jgi:magnesium chelatase family protein